MNRDLPQPWSLDEVLAATGGTCLARPEPFSAFSAIGTDSRRLQPNQLFVALRGDTFDGFQFAAQAAADGATGLLVNRDSLQQTGLPELPASVAVVAVDDTLTALGDLAAFRRASRRDLPVVALTGSCGKTTVKEMTAAVLGRRFALLKTEGNFNNLIGLPLTLFRLAPAHQAAVLELGMNRPGEIARLTEIADPDLSCIVNVKPAHLEGLGSIEGVARAKGELFDTTKEDRTLIVNLDDPHVRRLAKGRRQRLITFAAEGGRRRRAMVRASRVHLLGAAGLRFSLHVGSEKTRLTLHTVGRHNVSNALAAAAIGHGMGMGIKEIAAGLETFRPYDKRNQLEELACGALLLNDAYNANPASMAAALRTLAELYEIGATLAVLGDMFELGPAAAELHRELGTIAARLGIQRLAAVGKHGGDLVAGALAGGMLPDNALAFADKNALLDWLDGLHRDGQFAAGHRLLVKGSRGMRMETVVEHCRLWR